MSSVSPIKAKTLEGYPEGFTQKDLDDFVAYRKKLKVPVTDRAVDAFRKKINRLVAEGNDLTLLLDVMYERGWRSVYANEDTRQTGNRGGWL